MKLRTLLIFMCLTVAMIPIGIIGGINGFESTSFMLIGLILLVTFVVSFGISYFITRSIVKLTKNIDMISKGTLDVTIDSSEIYEINNLTESLNRIMASLKLAVKKVGVKKDEIFVPAEKPNIMTAEKWTEREIDAICFFDEKANVVGCNDNMQKKLGYSKDEMLTLNLADIDALESKENLIEKLEQVKKQGEINNKTIFKTKDNASIFVFEKISYDPKQKNFRCIVNEE